MAEQSCAHENCDCIVQDGDGITKGEETYCSAYCAGAGPSESAEACDCDHKECS